MELKIKNLERDPSSGLVTSVHWIAVKKDETEEFTSTYSTTQGMSYKDSSDPSFIPFDQLTESQVVGWIVGEVGEYFLEKLSMQMDADLEFQKSNKTVTTTPPWDNIEITA
jgi:hypothetical protein